MYVANRRVINTFFVTVSVMWCVGNKAFNYDLLVFVVHSVSCVVTHHYTLLQASRLSDLAFITIVISRKIAVTIAVLNKCQIRQVVHIAVQSLSLMSSVKLTAAGTHCFTSILVRYVHCSVTW